MSNVPILVVLGTKRSLATALTGKSYLQLNFLHRLMARRAGRARWRISSRLARRAIWVCLAIHSILCVRIAMTLTTSNWRSFQFFSTQKLRGQIMRPFGIISFFGLTLIVMCVSQRVMCGLADCVRMGIAAIRRRFYQLWYWSHQIGVVVFLGFGVAHVPLVRAQRSTPRLASHAASAVPALHYRCRRPAYHRFVAGHGRNVL